MTADIFDLNEKRLERLSPGRLAGELMRLPAGRRLEVVLERPDSEAVVAALDPNDFFFFVQELGADDSLPLLALARVEQITHLFDLEWWGKDAVEPAKALLWLDRLARASERKLLEWLYKADFELLIALFGQWAEVAVAPEDADPIEARETLPRMTLDELYFWDSRYPQYEDLIARLFTLIFEANYNFFKELMHSVLYAPAAEVEEQAYHFHKARLSDNFIADYYDALEIYRAIKPGEFSEKKPFEPTGQYGAPSLALALMPEGDLLGRAARELRDAELQETLRLELASLGNKVAAADRVPLDNAAALRQAVEKALAYVNLGLEIKSGGDGSLAVKTLSEVFLEHLFRLAHTQVSAVKGRLLRVVKYGWLARCPGATKCLDREWYDAAEWLLARTPKLLRHRTGDLPRAALPREDFFRTMADLSRADHIVDVITAVGHLYTALDADPRGLEAKLWRDGQVRALEDVTLGTMIFTAAGRFLVSGAWSLEPLAVPDWPRLFALLQPPEMDRVVMDWVYRVVPEQGGRNLAAQYIGSLLRDYDFEMRPFSPENPPEPQLVPFFIFQEGS